MLAGCGAPRTSQRIARPTFPEAEYAALPRTGIAIVSGQGFLKTRGGDVKTAAGNTVFLEPATSYSKFANELRLPSNVYVAPPDPRMKQYTRETVADGSGRFSFKNVPDGEYYLGTTVSWEAPTGYKFSLQTQGGLITKKIAVKNGEPVDVMLTR